MISLPVRLGLSTSGLACLLAVQAMPAAAQEERKSTNEINWQVGASKGGWCVQFLMDQESASNKLAKDHRVVLARDASGLSPAIARLISDEPQYADWVPSEVCTYMAEAIWIEGRRFDRGNGNNPIAAIYWGVAAAAVNGAAGQSRMSLRYLGTNSSALKRAMDSRTVPIDEAELKIEPVKESTDEQITLKLEGATIVYIGKPRPDTAAVAQPRTQTGVYMGNNRALWTVNFEFIPSEVAAMSGALRIVGKRNLAKALDHSPIRLLSPMISGGKGTVAFTK